MNHEIEIVKPNEAKKLLSDKEFLVNWSKLARTDHKNSVVQEPAFVISWYNQYDSQFSPLLILANDEERELVGLMPLAIENETENIVHAGAWQAEYHGWIAHPDIDDVFPIEAVIAIKNAFKLRVWQWRWMPPKSPIAWIHSPLFKKHGISVEYDAENSPLWDLNDEARIEKLFKNKAIKWSINRYKKRGGVSLERITNKNRARLLMRELRNQCDFRQMAANGISPFREDPFKESLFIEKLNYPESFHFTVLWCDKKPIAFNHGSCDDDTVYLGLSGFEPTEAKDSPGKLSLVYLAKFARAEGYRYIDLTPGGDSYKGRFANCEQTLYKPRFYFNKFETVRGKSFSFFKKTIKSFLTRRGKKLGIFEHYRNIDIRDYRNRLERLTSGKVIRKLFQLFYEHRIYLYYRLRKDTSKLMNSKSVKIHKQNYSDLLEYSAVNPWKSKRDLISEAFNRFASGDILYSIMKDGCLVHWGWLTRGGKTHTFTEVGMTFESPANSLILNDFFTEPEFRRQGLYQRNLNEMIHDSFVSGGEEVYIGVNSDNIASRKAIEKVGFSLHRTFIKKKFLFYTHKSSF